MPESTPATVSIELNRERIITLHGKHRSYKLTCRRVTAEDWTVYFGAILVGGQQVGRDRISTFDIQTPRMLVADRVIVAADGYKVAGDVELMNLENWQQLIPLAHRLAVGDILSSARSVTNVDDDTIYPQGEPVSLSCIWSDEGKDMEQVSGLVHVLRAPKEIQHRRYMREASRTRVLGGDRTGETIYPGAQLVLAELYDELVVSVEGYTVDGAPLIGPQNIAREMDMHHKVMAAQEIFQPREQNFAKKPAEDDAK